MNQFKQLLACVLLTLPFLCGAAPATKIILSADDMHPLAIWHKPVEQPRAVMLLLHGRTYSALPDFDLATPDENLSLMDALTARGFKVYALDGRGYGSTTRDPSGWLTPSRAVNDVVNTLHHIRKQHAGLAVHLFGWSYGSMVAQWVGQMHPELIDSVVLFGYPFDPTRHVLPPDQAYPATPPKKPNTRAHAASDFITPGSISDDAVEAYVNLALKHDPIRVDFKDLHQWATLDPRKLFVPTLLMHGQFDPLTSPTQQQALFTSLGAERKWWVVLAGGDHAALLETPRHEMVEAISTFTSF